MKCGNCGEGNEDKLIELSTSWEPPLWTCYKCAIKDLMYEIEELKERVRELERNQK